MGTQMQYFAIKLKERQKREFEFFSVLLKSLVCLLILGPCCLIRSASSIAKYFGVLFFLLINTLVA